MNSFDEIRDRILKEEGKIIVTSHVVPDGDAIGAGLGLSLALKKIGKDVRFVLQDRYPENIGFLDKIEILEVFDEEKNYAASLIICVDGATANRLGKAQKLLEDRYVINIDHHISNTKYGDLNFVEDISSTSELIYKFLKFCKIDLDVEIAEALYTGLVNDTGNFSHDNVTPHTFSMASELVKIGADSSKIVREFFNTKTYPALKLTGLALYKMEFENSKKLAYFYMSQEDLKKYGGKKEDTEGVVEKLLSYKEAEISLFIREDGVGVYKGSMRSKYDKDVNSIANIFGGGGHIKAAGFTTDRSPEEIVKIVLENL